jgi:hypothetical protein
MLLVKRGLRKGRAGVVCASNAVEAERADNASREAVSHFMGRSP